MQKGYSVKVKHNKQSGQDADGKIRHGARQPEERKIERDNERRKRKQLRKRNFTTTQRFVHWQI